MGVVEFDWTDSGSQNFTGAMRLQQQRYRKARRTYPTESLDYSGYEVVTVGSGVNEIVAFIRHDTQHSELRDLADALRRGISMTLTPDNDSPGTTFTVVAVGEVPDPELESEGREDLYRLGPLRLRRLDGGAFEPA